MGLIRYKSANAVSGVAGKSPPQPLVDWVEAEEHKTLNLGYARQEDTTWTAVSTGGSFTVDDTKYPELIKALDASPHLYRAGGGQPALANVIRTD